MPDLKVVRGPTFGAILRFGLAGLLIVVCVPARTGSASAASSSVASAWGDNTYGQLGDGHEGWGYDSKVPIAVSGSSGVKSVAAGGSEGLAAMENGTVMAWGNNAGGELGNASNVQTSDVPVAVPGLSGVTAVASGDGQDLALLDNGTVMAWGANDYGQLGVGSTSGPEICSTGIACSRTPVPVNGLSGVKAIAANGEYSLALLDNGTVMAWGEDTWGQLGNGKSGEGILSDVPVAVSGLSGVRAISAGNYDGLALLEDGTVKAWGVNGSGELGNGSTTGPESCVNDVACSAVPVPVSGLSGVTAIAEGGLHGLAVLSDGTVKSWGYNLNGQLGDGKSGEEAGSDVPVAVSGLSGVSAVAAGKYDSLALLSNGTVKSWGWDLLWELGNLSVEEESLVPVPVNGLEGVTAIAANEGLSLAIGGLPVSLAQVNRLEPYSGPEAGGTAVTITGVNFTGATAVKFGSSDAASFTVNSDTSITAVSPAHASGSVEVTVTTPEGASYTSPRDSYRYGPIEGSCGGLLAPASQCCGRENEPLPKCRGGEVPVIESEAASNITEHGTTVEAEIKPEFGTELTYFVEYGTTTSYGTSAPTPPTTIRWATCGLVCEGEDEIPWHVSMSLTGLEAGTPYHYRLIATNSRGRAAGEDATFTTVAPEGMVEPLALSSGEEKPTPNEEKPTPNNGVQSGPSGVPSGPANPPSTAASTPIVPALAMATDPSARRAHKLVNALKACRREPRSKQVACKKQVRARYGSKSTKKSKRKS